MHSHIGYGIDDPIDRDIASASADLGRVRNSTLDINLLCDLNQTVRVEFEAMTRICDAAELAEFESGD